MGSRLIALPGLLLLWVALIACTPKAAPQLPPTAAPQTSAPPSGERLRVATTTSLYDTGLWDVLEPAFEAKYGIEMDVISGGTGRALDLGVRGDVDVLAIHDKPREEKFIADGNGTRRSVIAYNYFVIVGPESDPVGIRGIGPAEAFQAIEEMGRSGAAGVAFVSRGDDSGTHSREKSIWSSAGFDYEQIRNSGVWYVESGSGMGATLTLANEKAAYTISDIGTILAFKGNLDLVPLVEKGGALLNVYAFIPVNPENHQGIKSDGAEKLVEFLTSDEAQDIIESYGLDRYGTPLFRAARGVEPTE